MTLSFIRETVAGAEKEDLLKVVERYGGSVMKPEDELASDCGRDRCCIRPDYG